MERRVLLAVVLSFVVLYVYQTVFAPRPTPPQPASPAAGGVAGGSTGAGSAATSTGTTPQIPPSEAAAVQPVVAEASERDVVIETAKVRATFTNRGGRLKQWLLKDYRDERGALVNLVPTNTPPDVPLPFSLRVEDGTLSQRLNSSVYRVTQAGSRVAFDYQDVSGLQAHKEFQLDPQGFVVTFSAWVRQGDTTLNPFVQLGPGLGDSGAVGGGGSFFTGNYVQPPNAIVHTGDDVERPSASEITEQPLREGEFRFVGVDDHYFIVAVVNPGRTRVEYRPVTLPAVNDPTLQRQFVAHTYRFAQPPTNVKFYVGPKSFDVLKSVDGEFVRAIHFGIFAWMVVPLLGALKSIYGFVGNYGWAIIILTILINIAIFPLRHKSVVSMRKMQELQPQLKAIQDRYADLKVTDPARQKMNTEIMNLYREKGVNPASGCIPMLLTFPVLFAFYALLGQSIELRGAEFGLWIKDLSRHDPYFVTPILMGITMFWQQKITPSAADPAQQRMMMMMPLIFGVMLLWAPSGLVIYWFVSNLWAIGQQYFTNWLIGPPAVHVVRPAAERRLKNAGSGRTERAEKRS